MTSLLYLDSITRSVPDIARLRREYKRIHAEAPALLGKGDGNDPYFGAGTNRIWVRRDGIADENGNIGQTLPEKVFCGSGDYYVYDGARVWLETDPNGQWQVKEADNRDSEIAGLHTGQLNSGNPTNNWLRLKNATRLKALPVGTADNPSTLVGVHGMLYDDNYGDLTRFTATALAASKFDLASYIPTSGNHAVVIVWLDTINNVIVATSSTAQAVATALDITDYQEAFADRLAETIPIQAFHLGDGQSSVSLLDLGEDLRQFVNMPQVLGFPNPVVKDTIIRAGRTVTYAGDLTVTGNLTVLGDLTILDEDTRITSVGGTFGDHLEGDYSAFEDDGTLRMEGDATVWDDLRVPGLAVAKGASAPDLISWGSSGNLLVNGFDGGATTEQVYFTCQLPHGYKEGSDVYPHVHWGPINANAGNVKWQLEYSWSNVDDAFPAPTTISIVDAASGTAWDHQIAPFGAVTGTGKKISSMFVCRLFRDPTDGSDTYASDVGFLEFDIHFQLDTIASRQQFIK